LYDESDVIEVTKENFDNLVIGSDNVWMVQFYATWCKACLFQLRMSVNSFFCR
jgi:protein disulfide-isomerase A6